MRLPLHPAALRGLRILDLSEGVAGPYCTKLLAGFGAEVIKVEPPGGDRTRGREQERSPLFLHLNAGKRSIVLDAEDPRDLDVIHRLAVRSDLVVESWAPGLLDQRGLAPAGLQRENPLLVVTSITPFGQTGPYRDLAGSELVLQALGGYVQLVGEADREPLKLAGHQAQCQAGLQAALASLAALWLGGAHHLDVSVMESVVFLLHQAPQLFHRTGRVTLRDGQHMGGREPTMHYPVTTLPCRDGYVHVHTDVYHWESLALLFEEPRLLDPRLEAEQHGHADEIDALMQPWLNEHTRAEIVARGQELRLPFTSVLDVAELLEDLQHRARRLFVEVEHPVAGRLPFTGAPVRLSRSPYRVLPPPLLGEHTQAVLAELGETERGGRGKREGGREDTRAASRSFPLPTSHFPLRGVRVLDLTHILAGPFGTQVLADLGAEVVKIEGTRRWDRTRGRVRRGEGHLPAWNSNVRFNEVNRNKLDVSLDLGLEAGRRIFLTLVRCADVVIENFSSRVMRNFGLSYADLRRVREDIIMVSMPGFGASGPYRDFLAHGPGGEAMSGLQSLTGYEGGPPQATGGFYGDETSGVSAALAVVVALHHRERTGEGQYVDLAMREALASMLGEEVLAHALTGRAAERSGNRHTEFAPQGCYPCASDSVRPGWVALTIATDAEWGTLCGIIGRPDLGADAGLASAAGRRARASEVDQAIAAWTSQRSDVDAMRRLQASGLRGGAALDATQVLTDPHLAARGFFQWREHPVAGTSPHSSLPWLMDGQRPPVLRPAPCYAQDLDYVFDELLGVPVAEKEELLGRRVVSREPVVD